MNFRKTSLKNGLRVLTIPMEGTQTVTVMVMVGVGSRFEKEKEAGLSHFIEHMLFKGTEKRPTAQIISEEMDAIGGEFNAFTSKDKTAYYAKIDARHLTKALDVVTDIFLNSKIEQAEIEKESGTILQELAMYEDEPRRSVGDELENLLYGDSPMGRNIVGNKNSIVSFKRKNFLSYMKKYYSAKNTILCVAGKFEEKKVIEFAKKTFSDYPQGEINSFKKVLEKQSIPQVKIKFKKTDQTHLLIGNRAYHQNHKDRYVLTLLSVILGGNMSSRLFLEIREKLGLAYFVHTSVDTYQDCGYISTQAGVQHNKLEKTIEVTLKEYRKVADSGVSEKELQNAKDYVKGRAVMGLEASDDMAMFYIDQELHKEKVLTPEQVFAKIDEVTTSDVKRVAQDIFQGKKLNVAIIGPHRNNKKILDILIK